MKTILTIASVALCLIIITVAPANAGTTIPESLRPVLYELLAKDDSVRLDAHNCADNVGRELKACFATAGVRFTAVGGTGLQLHLAAFGRDGALHPVTPVAPAANEDGIAYVHPGITEWWRALPSGFEQGFTLSKRPAGSGQLILSLAASDAAVQAGDALAWGNLQYGKLVVTDANGAVVPAALSSNGNKVLISVSDADAIYPLTVDPLVWLAQETGPAEGVNDNGSFGYAVAVDGDTAIIGAYYANTDAGSHYGSAYVFSRANGTWSQTATLAPDDAASGMWFGGSVALTGDTAVIGAPYATGQKGAVYIFTRGTDGNWSQLQKLVASDGASGDYFGKALAIDGTSLMVGSPNAGGCGAAYCAGPGAVYVFAQSGGTWMQVDKLTDPDAVNNDQFGIAVSLSGTTAFIGAMRAKVGSALAQGAAYVFTQDGGFWTQAQKLTASDGAANAAFGSAIAVTGGVAVIGAQYASTSGASSSGEAYVFTRADDGTWAETAQLEPAKPAIQGQFGNAVATDGTAVLVGYHPSNKIQAYKFTQNSDGSWKQDAMFAPEGPVSSHNALALAGSTVIVAAPSQSTGYHGKVFFEGQADLDLSVTQPAAVEPGDHYVSEITVVNNGDTATPGVPVIQSMPSSVTYVSAEATQGACSKTADAEISCDFGSLDSAGSATAKVTFRAVHIAPETIHNTATVVGANPGLTGDGVTSIDDAPIASDASLTTDRNKPASGALKAVDQNADSFTFSIVAEPDHGSISLDDAASGAFTYTPAKDYSGSDSFTFKADDGQLASNTATVSVTVNAPAPPPGNDDDAPGDDGIKPPAQKTSSGGGGAMGGAGLLLLTSLTLLATRRRRFGGDI